VTPEQYAAQQAVLSAATVNYVLQFAQFFARPILTAAQWLGLLNLLFPEIYRLRQQSASLARDFYDSQREEHHPNLPLNERFLEDYEFEWFVENMDPVRQVMSQADSPEHAMASLALRAVREVENAGRRQIIHAVENEPADGVIRGWARVATGAETCAWCLMLVSRGPVYMFASSAGLRLDDTTAARMVAAGTDVSAEMDAWHDGCDCKVVPVFVREQSNWPGKQAAKRALELWNEATKEAIAEEDKGLVHPSGKKKGKPFTRNELAINALRRRMERGEIDASEFAALAA
jgi:hypothetical protein